MENSLGAPQKPKHRVTIWPRNSTPRCIPRRKIHVHKKCVHEYLEKQAKTGKTHMFTDALIDKQNMVYPYGALSTNGMKP